MPAKSEETDSGPCFKYNPALHYGDDFQEGKHTALLRCPLKEPTSTRRPFWEAYRVFAGAFNYSLVEAGADQAFALTQGERVRGNFHIFPFKDVGYKDIPALGRWCVSGS